MWFFYLVALIPVIIGAVIWVKDNQVTWWEWLAGSGIGFLLAIIFHLMSFYSMTGDIETWSGRLTIATFHPQWVEEYQEMHTRTVGSGKNARTEVYFTTEHRTHYEHWTTQGTLDSYRITHNFYNVIAERFGCVPKKTRAYKSGFDGGDPNIYVATNITGHVIPTVDVRQWTNKVQASPSVFSFVKVPESIKVYEYPPNPSVWESGRLLGTAKAVGIYEWDQMNARLGPTKKVNVIMVGFPAGTETMIGQYQQAKWIGGKKNDLVITYAGSPGQKPEWVFTFGWTEQEIVKRNLDQIVANMTIDKDLIPQIEEEVRRNYTIKDWDKFDYLGIEPPGWSYIVFLIVMALAQGGFYFFAHMNEFRTLEGY